MSFTVHPTGGKLGQVATKGWWHPSLRTRHPDPAAVRDVGCGTGALLRLFADRLPAAVVLSGVDPAPTMLEWAAPCSEHTGASGLPRSTAEQLPFQAASFDLVVSTVSFAHWADQPAGLAEIARVLRPGGRLVLVDLFAIGWLRPGCRP
jgi:ubiquinone/menaquinone biosynthesis C-methylase UbiE